MRIFLTGGTGYIGSHVAVILSELGFEVTLFDNLSNSSDSVVKRIAAITGRGVSFIRGDLREQDSIRAALQCSQPSAVMHFAALKSVGQSVDRPLEYYSNNLCGTLNLLEAMTDVGLKTLIFSSSATVYGSPTALPIDELHSRSAVNPYGRSKLQVEDILDDLAKSDQTWRIACLRYFNPVGAHDSSLIGEDNVGTPNNLMPIVVQVASGERANLQVFGNDYETPDGTGMRDYIHVVDLAEGHVKALDFLANNNGCHAFNLGTGRSYSVLEIIRTFEETSGVTIPFEYGPRRPGDIASCYADPTKAERLLNWSAKRGLSEMCESAWRYSQAGKIQPSKE